ncbi:MAG: HAMP domain-containing histidine kinase, partial [Candidatus Tectomicrobia bacterium]|nr:HAMP domain-containing histidine kinase [Candidatus Tectomicrobia bacterium]
MPGSEWTEIVGYQSTKLFRLILEERSRLHQNFQRSEEEFLQIEKLKLMGEMASGVAHHMNNLLASVLGGVEILLRSTDRLKPEESQKILKVIETSARDGAETVRNLQKFVHKKSPEAEAVVDLGQLVRQALDILQSRWKDEAQKQGIPLHLHLHLPESLTIRGYPHELREVFTNLIVNALDAMPAGGTLTIRSWVEDEWGCLSISDTGIGMPKELMERAFEPFFTTKGVGKGTGLGLTISAKIMKKHGGKIVLQSEVGQGTTFMLKLPLATHILLPIG